MAILIPLPQIGAVTTSRNPASDAALPENTARPAPLRVLHLTAGSDAGGLSRYIHELCSAMHAQGHSVAVAGERGVWHSLFENAPWPWVDAPLKGGPLALLRAARIIRRHLAEHPVDVLHVHYRRPAMVARLLQRTTGLPILYTLHLSDLSLSRAYRLLSDFGDHTHAASVDAVRWLTDVARVPADRITLIPHGVRPDRFPVPTPADKAAARARLGLPAGATVAAYVGRLDDPKNESWLLDLAAATYDSLPHLHVLLAGDGPHAPDLRRRLASDPRLAARVHLLGTVDPPLPVYHAADALLLPSAREGFSLVCAEAMSTGIPALRTRTAGTTETTVEGVTGRSSAIDHDAFLSAAATFLTDRGALARMGAAAADHVRRHLTFDRQLAMTLDLYRRLARRPHDSTVVAPAAPT
jgi:glycosyltransferase involved in cell wall biosynthesis